MDRIEEWRVFAAVAGLRSFSRAARQLRKSPQAATRAVAALEARLGTRLLHRTTRAVTLTHDGEQYLERARRALADLEALEAPLDATAELRGTLAVTAPVLFGQLHVVPVVASFLDRHPGVSARLVLLDRVVSLAEEGIDVGVRIGALPDSALVARPLGHVRTVLCASEAYLERAGTPRSVDALAKHACIEFLPFPRRVQPRWIVNTAQAAIELALAGRGITRVLSYQTDPRLRIVLPSAEPPPAPVHLVYQAGRLPRITVAFLDHAAPLLRDVVAGRRGQSSSR
jgi:DNA-binding transcriptional LysR family regulator